MKNSKAKQLVEKYMNYNDTNNVSCVFDPPGIWTDAHGDSKSSNGGLVFLRPEQPLLKTTKKVMRAV